LRVSKEIKRMGSEQGSGLIITLFIMGALTLIGTSLVLSSVRDRTNTRYVRHGIEALGAAETGLSFAKRRIQDLTAPMEDYDADDRQDFTLAQTMSWGGDFDLIAEASDITGPGVAAYRANGFTIVSEGRVNQAIRRVRAQIAHGSFLEFARFVAETGLTMDCGAVFSGKVYVGGNLNMPCGCGVGGDAVFMEEVLIVGSVANAECATFMKGYEEGAEEVDLIGSVDFNEIKDTARGLSIDSSCEGWGAVGIYSNLPGVDPLNIAATMIMDLGLFDYYDMSSLPPDTVVSYNGVPVMNTLTGSALRASEFNGMIFFDGRARVFGTAEGHSGRTISIFSNDDICIMDNIFAGRTGFNPGTGLPNGTGDPVNIGLVAKEYINIDIETPRVLTIEAALMAVNRNWRCWKAFGAGSGTKADHPIAGPGPIDLDFDGVVGESPINDDPLPGLGWDELNIDADTWLLTIKGTIIAYNKGDSWPWSDGNVLLNADGSTRKYIYDMDLTKFPPPCFPKPINVWIDVNWTEIFETDSDLSDNLPN
jgi:hypothetical protein